LTTTILRKAIFCANAVFFFSIKTFTKRARGETDPELIKVNGSDKGDFKLELKKNTTRERKENVVIVDTWY